MKLLTQRLSAALQNLAETVAEICPTLDADVQSEARAALAAYDALTPQERLHAMSNEINAMMLEQLDKLIQGLAEQQAMPDDAWRIEYAEIRKALTSQPSGEAMLPELPQSFHSATNQPDRLLWPREKMIEYARAAIAMNSTHPSADAPGVAVDEWLPIETAPAGVPILVRYVNSAGKERVIKARFIQRFTEESSSDCDEGVDEYDEANDRYTYCEGWWEMIDNWDDFAFVTVSEGSPTHWHKIPSTAALAPKPEGGHG